jgi:hypothetical protein
VRVTAHSNPEALSHMSRNGGVRRIKGYLSLRQCRTSILEMADNSNKRAAQMGCKRMHLDNSKKIMNDGLRARIFAAMQLHGEPLWS